MDLSPARIPTARLVSNFYGKVGAKILAGVGDGHLVQTRNYRHPVQRDFDEVIVARDRIAFQNLICVQARLTDIWGVVNRNLNEVVADHNLSLQKVGAAAEQQKGVKCPRKNRNLGKIRSDHG